MPSITRAATLTDVARLADVSVKTASNVATGRVHVSDATRRRVQQAIDELVLLIVPTGTSPGTG